MTGSRNSSRRCCQPRPRRSLEIYRRAYSSMKPVGIFILEQLGYRFPYLVCRYVLPFATTCSSHNTDTPSFRQQWLALYRLIRSSHTCIFSSLIVFFSIFVLLARIITSFYCVPVYNINIFSLFYSIYFALQPCVSIVYLFLTFMQIRSRGLLTLGGWPSGGCQSSTSAKPESTSNS